MKVIIAGGRHYQFTTADYTLLDTLHAEFHFTEVVHGDATGADSCGAAWAALRGIPTQAFPAEWAQHGHAAGPIRNTEMIHYVGKGGMLVAFPGGRGTTDIVNKAMRGGLSVIHTNNERRTR